ncbi:MAG TPA: hypothetical protein VK629_16370 [Steroidobacteraceae bacterium]|nr:hypothetical protein [Steroidobacteraceae bacterium]
MIDPTEYPWLFAGIALLSTPIYRGLAVSIFGTSANFKAALRYWLLPSTWTLLEETEINWQAELRMFFLVGLCVGFVAAVYDTCVKYFV